MFPTKIFVKYVNPIQDGPFRGCSRMRGKEGAKSTPFSQICFTYAIIMKLGTVISYLKKIQKK